MLQILDKVADLVQFAGDANVLWTMGFALSAADAVVGLTQTRYGTVESDEVVATQFPILFIHLQTGQRAFVLTLIIMYKDSWNVNTIGTGHTVFAVIAGDGLETNDTLGHVFVQVGLLLFRQRLQRTIGEQVVFQVFHEGHATEYR